MTLKKLRNIFTPIGLILLLLGGGIGACSRVSPSLDMSLAAIEPNEIPSVAHEIGAEDIAIEEAGVVNHCLDCHTDKQTLIDTAKPEEEVVSESSGEG